MGDVVAGVLALLAVWCWCGVGVLALDGWALEVARRSRSAAARELYAGQLRHAADVAAKAAPFRPTLVDRAVVAARAAAPPADADGLHWYCRRCCSWLEGRHAACSRCDAASLPGPRVLPVSEPGRRPWPVVWMCGDCRAACDGPEAWLDHRCAARPRLDFAPFRFVRRGEIEAFAPDGCGSPTCCWCYLR